MEWDEMFKILLDNGGDPLFGGYHTSSSTGAVFAKGFAALRKYYVYTIAKKGLITCEDQTGYNILDVPSDKVIQELLHMHEYLKNAEVEYGYDWSNYFKYIDRYLKDLAK